MAERSEHKTGEDISLTGLVSMIPVTDVERSVEFYKHLGLAVGNRVPKEGRMNWVWLYSPIAPDWRRGPNLMLSRTDRLDPSARGVLFYFYVSDLVGLRERLLTDGLHPGQIEYPDYLPEGEFALQDPDGHCLMLAQNTSDTP